MGNATGGNEREVYLRYSLYISLLTTGILLCTLVAICWYAYETRKLRKHVARQIEEQGEASTFAALTRVHECMSGQEAYYIRGYLFTGFLAALAEVTGDVFGSKYAGGGRVKVDRVLKSLPPEGVDEFNSELDKKHICPPGRDPESIRYVAEKALADIDVMPLPYYQGIRAAKDAADAYRTTLARTAEFLLPFVAIQTKLRGTKEHPYKKHYLYLLQGLGINLQGLDVPE